MTLEFTVIKADSNLCFKVEGRRPIILMLYVDDLFLVGKEGLIKYARRILAVEFKMKELGMMHYFLGMEVWQNVVGISLGQGKYLVDIMKRFRMMDCMTTPMAPTMKLLSDASSEMVDTTMYRQMIGSLMYLIPDIFFVVNTLIHVHLMVAKHAGV